jgi:glycerophosphoryl diester phosphodiesterase
VTNQATAGLAASHRDPGQALTPRSGDVRLVAHRGSGHAHNDPDGPPENTLAAVRYGFAQGADAVEIDVWCTADGVVVLHHDLTTDRTTDRTGLDIPTATAADLRALSAGRWKHERWAGEGVPTLSDAATLVPAGRALYVEIVQGPQVVPAVVAAVRELADEQVVWISKNLDTIGEVKAAAPQQLAFWVVDTTPRWQIGGWAQGHRRGPDSARHGFDDHAYAHWLVEQAVAHDLDGLDTLFAYPPDLPAVVHLAGLRWMVWTVNDPRAVDQCLADGAWALTTDNTREVRQWLESAGMR